MENRKVNTCGEFPHFGATYPDATCIDGYLWDLDSYDDGRLTSGGSDPCPFCKREEYIEWLSNDDKEEVESHLQYINERYNQ